MVILGQHSGQSPVGAEAVVGVEEGFEVFDGSVGLDVVGGAEDVAAAGGECLDAVADLVADGLGRAEGELSLIHISETTRPY